MSGMQKYLSQVGQYNAPQVQGTNALWNYLYTFLVIFTPIPNKVYIKVVFLSKNSENMTKILQQGIAQYMYTQDYVNITANKKKQ